jgi:hypothetical protein
MSCPLDSTSICSTPQVLSQAFSIAQNNFSAQTALRSPRLCGLLTHAREGMNLLVMRAH